MSKESNKIHSDGFSGKFGFIIACIGSAVGMANIWRFPYLVSEYGGLTFLLPYILFVVVIACSGVMEEFALGRWGGAGPVGSFGKAAADRGLPRRAGFAGSVPGIPRFLSGSPEGKGGPAGKTMKLQMMGGTLYADHSPEPVGDDPRRQS